MKLHHNRLIFGIMILAFSGLLNAHTATYKLKNQGCYKNLDVTINDKSANGSVKINIGYRGFAATYASCNISGAGSSCDGSSINSSAPGLAIRGNFNWDSSTNLIMFNGRAIYAKCAEVEFINAPMGIVH